MEPKVTFQGIIFLNDRIDDITSFVIIFICLCQLSLTIRIQITECWRQKEIKDHLDSARPLTLQIRKRWEVRLFGQSNKVTTDYIFYACLIKARLLSYLCYKMRGKRREEEGVWDTKVNDGRWTGSLCTRCCKGGPGLTGGLKPEMGCTQEAQVRRQRAGAHEEVVKRREAELWKELGDPWVCVLGPRNCSHKLASFQKLCFFNKNISKYVCN